MSFAFTNGQINKNNQVLETYLRHFISPTMTDWDEWLSWAQFAYNDPYHESICATPFPLVLGCDSRTPLGSSSNKRFTQAALLLKKAAQFYTDRARTLLYAAQKR
jgi:hypothetical protein